MEADLLEFFGVDLLDLWRGRLSLRRLGVLIKSLLAKPGQSTLLAALDESAAWSVQEHLTARVSDALEISNYLFIKANSETKGLEVPEPIRRPGQVESPSPAPVFASGEEVSAFLAGLST
ncbi:hypothetical protein [Streptomyces luteireticuli]|uniref:Uncharacterized protein n=1 Tax=Streptomyces luteireticuli TaxID=173858 RepID=A0ABP3IIZ7_9ACTN